MEVFATQLHGMYSTILIGLILIVSCLSLTLLFFTARRIQREGSLAQAGVTASGSAVSAGEPGSLGSKEAKELQVRFLELQEESTKLRSMKDDYESLQQKVKFLESKLLEYEILQEEIGTLSTLKVENEKLKKEINDLQKEIDGNQKTGVSATAPAVAAIADTATEPPPDEPPMPDLSSDAFPSFESPSIDADAAKEPEMGAPTPSTDTNVEPSAVSDVVANFQTEPTRDAIADLLASVTPTEAMAATEPPLASSIDDLAALGLGLDQPSSATGPSIDLVPPPPPAESEPAMSAMDSAPVSESVGKAIDDLGFDLGSIPSEPAPDVAPAQAAAVDSVQAPVADEGLENLLAQIDSLTTGDTAQK